MNWIVHYRVAFQYHAWISNNVFYVKIENFGGSASSSVKLSTSLKRFKISDERSSTHFIFSKIVSLIAKIFSSNLF